MRSSASKRQHSALLPPTPATWHLLPPAHAFRASLAFPVQTQTSIPSLPNPSFLLWPQNSILFSCESLPIWASIFNFVLCVRFSLTGYYLLPGKIGGPNDIWLYTREKVAPFHICLDWTTQSPNLITSFWLHHCFWSYRAASGVT